MKRAYNKAGQEIGRNAGRRKKKITLRKGGSPEIKHVTRSTIFLRASVENVANISEVNPTKT